MVGCGEVGGNQFEYPTWGMMLMEIGLSKCAMGRPKCNILFFAVKYYLDSLVPAGPKIVVFVLSIPDSGTL